LLAAAGNSLVPSAAATGGVVRIEVATESGGAEVTGDGLLGILRLSVDPATEKTSAEIRLDLGSLRSAGVAAADTVLPDVTATLEIQLLVGDFNFDGKVDIIDFFQFADAFGSADPVFDLSGNGLVDLSDFFIFSDNFGTSLGKSVGALPAGSTELSMSLVGGGGGEQLEIKLSQRAGQPVRGLMLQLVFDPEILRMSSFQGPEQGRERFPLRAWIRGNTDGAATLLAGGGPVDLPAGQGGDLGAILFERRSGDGGVVRVSAAVVQTPGRAELLIETPQSLRFPALPADFVLYPAYPNPFNPETTLRFFLPQSSHVSLRVFDLTGRAVRVLVETRLSSGFQALVWDGRDQLGRAVGSGVYLVEMRAAGLRRVRKLMLIK
jgi:hypothetical protein